MLRRIGGKLQRWARRVTGYQDTQTQIFRTSSSSHIYIFSPSVRYHATTPPVPYRKLLKRSSQCNLCYQRWTLALLLALLFDTLLLFFCYFIVICLSYHCHLFCRVISLSLSFYFHCFLFFIVMLVFVISFFN